MHLPIFPGLISTDNRIRKNNQVKYYEKHFKYFLKKKMTIWGQIINLFWIIINWYLSVLKTHWREKSSYEVILESEMTLYYVISWSRRFLGCRELKKWASSVAVLTQHRDCEPIPSCAISKSHTHAAFHLPHMLCFHVKTPPSMKFWVISTNSGYVGMFISIILILFILIMKCCYSNDIGRTSDKM